MNVNFLNETIRLSEIDECLSKWKEIFQVKDHGKISKA